MSRRVRQRDIAGLSLSCMRLFINCSEPVRHDSHQQFLGRFAAIGAQPAKLSVSYAMAENTFGVTQTAPGRPPRADVVDGQILAEELRAEPVIARASEGSDHGFTAGRRSLARRAGAGRCRCATCGTPRR